MIPRHHLPIPDEILQDPSLDEKSRAAQVALVEEKYSELLAKLNLSQEEDWQQLEKAVVFAWGKHNKQKRDDGKPYILHPLEVAIILTEYSSTDPDIVVAAILHDVMEDCDVSYDTLSSEFSPTIAFFVDGLTKISEFASQEQNTGDTKQSVNYKKLLQTIEQDVRIMVIKLADRLHNMRTIQLRKSTKQRETASQTFYFYVPIAEYLGLYRYKSELEDLSFRYLEPARYEEIQRLLEGSAQHHEQSLSDFVAPIEKKLQEENILSVVTHRTKSIYSISQKLARKGVQFEDVYDLLAMRIVFEPIPDIPERTQCWYIYMLITDRQTVMHERTRDWVTSPKVNGYQALHCTMLTKEGYWVEVQIRTESMHRTAEYGVVSHALYKGQGAVPESIMLMRQHIKEEERGSSISFVDNFHRRIQTPKLQVYASDGALYDIQQGYTALDFAFILSNKMGQRTIAARINGKIVPLSRPLVGGDVVEFITASSQRITSDLVNRVVSSKAKSEIDMILKKQVANEIEKGKRKFCDILHDFGLDLEDPWLMHRICRAMGIITKYSWQNTTLENNLTQLYSGISNGNISLDILRRKVRYYSRWAFLYRKEHTRQASGEASSGANQAPHYVQLSCCYALPGDGVIGHRRGNNVYVHRTSCPEAVRLEAQGLQSGLVTVDWKPQPDRKYLVHIYVSGYDRPNLLAELFTLLGDKMRINIPRVTMQSDGNIFRGIIAVEITSEKVIKQIVHTARSIYGIRTVYRVDRGEVLLEEGLFHTVSQ